MSKSKVTVIVRVRVIVREIVIVIVIVIVINHRYVHALLKSYRRQMLTKILTRMTRRRVAAAFDACLANVCARKALKAKADAKVQGLFAISAIACRTDARVVEAAWLAWNDMVLDQRSKMRAHARVLSLWARCDRMVQVDAWVTWEEEVRTAKRARAEDARCARFLWQHTAHRVLRLWELFTDKCCAKKVRGNKAMLLARRALLGPAQHAWNKWCDDVRVARVAKRVLRRVCKRFVGNAMLSWQDMVRGRKCLRTSAGRVVSRWEHRACAKSLASWWHTAVYTRKKRTAMRMQRVHLLVRAVRSWSSRVVGARRSRALAARAMSRINSANGMLWRTWTEWEFYVCNMRAAKDRTGLSLVLSHAASTLSNHTVDTLEDSPGAEIRRRGIC